MKRRPTLHSATQKQGFTLIEVLIAAALFAVAASTLVGVVVNTLTALQSQETVSTQDADQAFILKQLNTIETREVLETGGRIPLPEDRWVDWDAEHEATEIADLHRIHFTFTWENDEDSEVQELFVYRLAPWLSEPSVRETLLTEKRRELEARQ